MSEYLVALQQQAPFCAYGSAFEDRVAELVLEGLDSKRVQDRILRECVGSTVLTLDRIVSLARQFEQLSITTKQLHRQPTPTPSSPLPSILASFECVATMQNGGHGAMASLSPIQY